MTLLVRPLLVAMALVLMTLPGPATAAATRQPLTGTFAYQLPPEPIAGALDAPARPRVLLSPARDRIALLERPGLPPIGELAEPELRLAGLSVNPRNNAPSRSPTFSGIELRHLSTGETHRAQLPQGGRFTAIRWAPDGKHLALLLLKEETVELWTIEAATGRARRLASGVNAMFPLPFEWLGDGSGLLVRLVPGDRGRPPTAPAVPAGPVIRETFGTAARGQTIQNLLANAHDEALFEHYATSRLTIVPLAGGGPRPVGAAGLIIESSMSPDGRYILQRRLKRPFSYAVTAAGFPEEVIVTNRRGRKIRTVAARPAPLTSLAGLPSGPRAVQWRADAPATLFWAERVAAGDTGDRLILLQAPFAGPPRLLGEVGIHFQSIYWGRPDLALAVGISPVTRAVQRIVIDPSGAETAHLLQPRAASRQPAAIGLLEWTAGILHLTGDGGRALVEVPDGLGLLDLSTGDLATLWSEEPGEELFAVLDRDADRLLSWRETGTAPPNLVLTDRTRTGARQRPVTSFPDPAPAYAGLKAERIRYRRADGRALAGTLYLPAAYDPVRDGALPALIWAYPGSVTGEDRAPAPAGPRQSFVRPTGFEDIPLLMTGRGYAVFRADMPLFQSAGAPPTDTYVPQIVANAEAAVAALVERGVAERHRIAIGGHSFGAAMAANLLAHSDLFRTGIALSGAYNRTLTPFGFQATERRSFWEAREAYLAMSPFVHADKIDEPILLVHGAADSNSGTYPMQSERLYEAISALGGKARYVLLPHEEHHYRARESLMHLMWEIDRWLAEQLSSSRPKDRKPASPAGPDPAGGPGR